MNVIDTIAEHGLTVRREGQQLIVKPAALLTEELRVLILEHKSELLAFLPDQSELDRLIAAVAAYHGFTEQTDEARQIAAGDPVNALTCFRALAAKAGIGDAE